MPLLLLPSTMLRSGTPPCIPSSTSPVSKKTSAHSAACETIVQRTATAALSSAGCAAISAPEPKSATVGASTTANAGNASQPCTAQPRIKLRRFNNAKRLATTSLARKSAKAQTKIDVFKITVFSLPLYN